MYSINFVSTRPENKGAEISTDTYGLVISKNEFVLLETVRYMRRLATLKQMTTARVVMASLVGFCTEYRAMVCNSYLENPSNAPWDVDKCGTLSKEKVLLVIPTIMDEMLNTSVSDDQFICWFDSLMRRKHPWIAAVKTA